MLSAGRVGAAKPLLAAARRLLPPQPGLDYLAARLELHEGNPAAARATLDRVIESWPDHMQSRKLRVEVALQSSDLAAALHDAAECVLQAPEDAGSKALLGAVLLEAGQPQDAVTCLREAVAAEPTHAGYAGTLAAAQNACGDLDAGLATLLSGIAATPGSVALRNAAILHALRRRDFETAVTLANAARKAGIADACTFGLQGHALSSLGQHEDATEAYREALKLGPHDPYVRHLVAAAGIVASADRAPDDYVRTVFDGYAERFEEHLINLGYRVPGLIRAVILKYVSQAGAGAPLGPILDLGCGTGLVGVCLSDMRLDGMVGVDLSPRMLHQAELKGLYKELHESDIQAFLDSEARVFPLIIAADVLCYFGDLRPVLRSMAQRLDPGGLCILSLEQPDAPGAELRDWVLGRQGRFGHSHDYVVRAVQEAGLVIHEIRREPLRQEAGADVPGFLLVLGRAS